MSPLQGVVTYPRMRGREEVGRARKEGNEAMVALAGVVASTASSDALEVDDASKLIEREGTPPTCHLCGCHRHPACLRRWAGA